MKKAWIENGKVRDVAYNNPADIFHPDVAVLYDTDVPDNAEHGDGWVNGVLVKPEPLARVWLDGDFRKGMTLTEKAKWDNNSSPEIITVRTELPQERAGTTELAQFLVNAGVISQDSANKILE
jgi:hypothetical protein